jgi:dihydroorotase
LHLKEEILKEHSKAQTQKIIDWVSTSQQRFDELVQLFLGDEYRVTQRAAWSLSYIAVAHPQLAKKHLPAFIKLLGNPKLHKAVRRNVVRLLQFVDIPMKLHGEVMNYCFDFIADVNEAAAVKAFSLTVLENLSKKYPEIKGEIKTIIEERWDYETPAFHSRAKKFLKD